MKKWPKFPLSWKFDLAVGIAAFALVLIAAALHLKGGPMTYALLITAGALGIVTGIRRRVGGDDDRKPNGF